MKIAFYNVENLFDTLDDPFINDDQFLPGSDLRWDQKRYILKVKRLARVISNIESPMPAFLGLAEVENARVLTDLSAALGLSEQYAGIIHEESPDERGIDVGAIYRKDIFKSVKHESLKVQFTETPWDRTRDILHVESVLLNNEKVHFFVNHWPSRKDGEAVSQVKRTAAADIMVEKLNEICQNEKDPLILVMGDFNCNPDSAPVRKLLQDRHNGKKLLINLSEDAWKKGLGSTTYRKKWLMFDQILASPELCTKSSGINIDPWSFSVFKKDWMLFYNRKYDEYRPDKTYGGGNYHGGFSDHLPVHIHANLD